MRLPGLDDDRLDRLDRTAVTVAQFSTTALIWIAARLRSRGAAGNRGGSGHEHNEHRRGGDHPEVPYESMNVCRDRCSPRLAQ